MQGRPKENGPIQKRKRPVVSLTAEGANPDPPAALTAAGHKPRPTRAVLRALGNEPIGHDIRRYKDLRKHCLDCSAGSKAGVQRCPIINCPLLAYRTGRNPHNSRRGRNPFQKIA